ncbi:MAG TPA: nitroreductase family protein [Lutibacter sp.]|nr:nitroreductase family protein [Lutibacter sp.]
MNNLAEQLDQIVDNRRSYRVYEKGIAIPNEVVVRSLERAIKAPNSSNMQLWEFYRIKSKEALKEVAKICLNQSGAVTASEIVVFVARPDLWKKRQAIHLKRLEKVKTKNIKNKLFGNSELSYYTKVIPMFYDTSFSFFRDLFKRIFIWNKSRKSPFMQDVFSKHVPVVSQKSTALAAQTFMLSITAEGYDSLAMEGLDAKRMKQYLKLPKSAEINMAIAIGKGKPESAKKRFRLDYDTVVFEM